MPRITGLSLLLIATLSSSLWESGAAAQPSPAAQASPAVRQACAADGNRLCVGVPREPDQMGRCIRQHWSELSAPCKSAILARRAALKDHPGAAAAPPPH